MYPSGFCCRGLARRRVGCVGARAIPAGFTDGQEAQGGALGPLHQKVEWLCTRRVADGDPERRFVTGHSVPGGDPCDVCPCLVTLIVDQIVVDAYLHAACIERLPAPRCRDDEIRIFSARPLAVHANSGGWATLRAARVGSRDEVADVRGTGCSTCGCRIDLRKAKGYRKTGNATDGLAPVDVKTHLLPFRVGHT